MGAGAQLPAQALQAPRTRRGLQHDADNSRSIGLDWHCVGALDCRAHGRTGNLFTWR